MFYETFTKLCKDIGKSPTATLQELKISTSKLTAWKNGSIPNGSIIILISEYFDVSTDYLLTGKEKSTSIQPSVIEFTNGKEKEIIRLFRQLPDAEKDRLIGRAELLVELANREENVG